MSAAKVRATVAGAAKVKRVRRGNWNPEVGPWGNGFDHAWRDAHRGEHLPEPSSRARLTLAERQEYTRAYHEARAILRGAGVVT